MKGIYRKLFYNFRWSLLGLTSYPENMRDIREKGAIVTCF
jgi:hypothetical protein